MLACYLAIQISNNLASKLKKVCTKSIAMYIILKFCTVQLSLSAKKAVVRICSIVATLLRYTVV